MMSVQEYADDLEISVDEVLTYCQELGIKVIDSNGQLTEEEIIDLDNKIAMVVDDEVIEQADEVEQEDVQIKKKSKGTFKERKKSIYKNRERLTDHVSQSSHIVLYKENMTVKELAERIGVSGAEIIKKLFSLGILTNINTAINFETAEVIVLEYDKELKNEETMDVCNFEEFEFNDDPKDLIGRPPIVTIMGHVDHGKTTLLDTIRKTQVASGEAGGITQTVGAYQTKCGEQLITFIDTPGHAAFTQMRARGASITDIVIIIVAADDGIMPQTKEAIDHAKAADVPIIVAINKIDKPEANTERVMTELTEYGLTPDTWGGETLYSNVSALTGLGISDLLENILLIASLKEYKANPNRYASGTVIESELDKQVGSIVTLIIQNGTLRVGDPIVVGSSYGRVRTMKNDLNEDITEAYPSQPVFITGLNELPIAGDKFMAFETEKQAKCVAVERKLMQKETTGKRTIANLDDLFSKIKDGIKEIKIIVKADLNGSAEALRTSLEQIEVEGVRVSVIRSSVGAVTENDIILAQASDAIIIGFNVRPSNEVRNFAKENNVEVRLYDVIYKAIEDVEKAMKGMLEPTYEEKITGTAEVRQLFKFSKVGTIAGSYVTDGVIKGKAKARVIRDGIVVYDGDIQSVQREKDTVREVKKGLECGITIEKFNDIKVGDIIEAYEMIQKKVI